MAEARSRQLAAAGHGSGPPEPQTTADIQRQIAAIRRRISVNLQAAEHRVSVAAGVEDFDDIPAGWRGLVSAGSRMLRNGRGSHGEHPASGGHSISRRIVVGTLMAAALITVARRRAARSKVRSAAGTPEGISR